MIPQQRSEIVQVLESSRDEFNAAAAGMAEAQTKAKPAQDRWSVLECVEHVVIVEERYLERLAGAARLETPRVDKQREAEITAQFPDRTTRRVAPEGVRPTGRFASLAQALEQFNATRSRVVRFAEDRGPDLYRLAAEHPRLGTVNGSEMLLIIAGHARRHADQIREIKAALASPAR
jgi:uncharacterized damage-inducible protein DinB